MAKRFISYLWIPALLLWTLILQPIWNLNVETIATSQGLNDELDGAAQSVDPNMLPSWFWDALTFLTGDFLWGAVTVGSIYFFLDTLSWLRRRRNTSIASKITLEPLSSIYTDAYRLEQELRSEARAEGHGRRPSPQDIIPIGTSSKVRSFFAQLSQFGVQAPAVSNEMTVEEALLVLDFLAIAKPFIGKSQIDELKSEAKAFVAKLQPK